MNKGKRERVGEVEEGHGVVRKGKKETGMVGRKEGDSRKNTYLVYCHNDELDSPLSHYMPVSYLQCKSLSCVIAYCSSLFSMYMMNSVSWENGSESGDKKDVME